VRILVALLVAAAFGGSVAGAAGPGRITGVTSFRICAAAGSFWPTETIAVAGQTGWVACKEESRVVKLDLRRGRELRSVRIGAPVTAVALGYRSVWALDSGGTLTRISPSSGRVSRRIALGASRPYNVWIGAGSVWVAADGSGEVFRVSPATNRVTARIAVGDGPADMAFDGAAAWVINHRDLGLVRIDTRTNTPSRLVTLVADAPERMALLDGSLWITGRGTDVLQVDPATGAVKDTIEIGASGIDVVAGQGALWVPARSAAVDRSGFPTMEALRRVVPGRAATTIGKVTGRVDVHGLVAAGGFVWLADNTNGVLYRVPA
jgi:YVTN family beta-propeller protein